MASQPRPYLSVQEYLEQEKFAIDRHEYLDGEIFSMPGGTLEHSQIASNIIAEVRPQLRNSECRVLGSDMRIRTSPTGLYSYADGLISCRPEVVEGPTLLNPLVIMEVLSERTQDYDRGGKFERYRQIPSFQEYLIVAQNRIYVEHHVRESSSLEAVWKMREFTNSEDSITLNAVSVLLPLASIYADVSLSS